MGCRSTGAGRVILIPGEQPPEEALDADFGVFTMKRFPNLEMPFVPTMSDGSRPVLGLFTEGRCIGIELCFDPEADE